MPFSHSPEYNSFSFVLEYLLRAFILAYYHETQNEDTKNCEMRKFRLNFRTQT